MLHKAWLRYWSIMVNVPSCRSLWQCNNVFRLDYNLCLAGANEISVRENESFQFQKMICFYFGYRWEWSEFQTSEVILREKQNYFWIGNGFRRTDGVILVKWRMSNHSSLVFPTSQTIVFTTYSSLCNALPSSVPACTERGAAFSTNDACLVLLPHSSRYQPSMASTPLFRLF